MHDYIKTRKRVVNNNMYTPGGCCVTRVNSDRSLQDVYTPTQRKPRVPFLTSRIVGGTGINTKRI